MTEKVEVESDIPGVGGTYDNLPLSTINTGLQQLEHFKKVGCSPKPKELEWEIKLYKWILAQPDSRQKADEYLKARHRGSGGLYSKREAVRILGWVIE
jgi:hypothetical protein